MKRFFLVLFFLILFISPVQAGAEKVQTKIVGGVEAPTGSWPSIAAVYKNEGSSTYLCGGSVVSSRWILTAGHCSYGAAPNAFSIVLGSNNRMSPAVSVSEVHVHPNYSNQNYANDIALLKLTSPTSQPSVQLAKPSQSDLFQTGDASYIAGWGETCYNSSSCPIQTMLRETDINISDYDQCFFNYASVNIVLPTGTICAAAPGKDACQGDSGGPMMIDNYPGQSPSRLQLGVVSGGVGCANPTFPGIYTNVSDFRSWVGSYVVSSLSGPSSLNWGRVKIKKTVVKTLNFENKYTLPVRVNSVKKSGSSRFSIKSNNCLKVLEARAKCTIKVAFKAAGPVKQASKISILSNGKTLRKVDLSGIGRR